MVVLVQELQVPPIPVVVVVGPAGMAQAQMVAQAVPALSSFATKDLPWAALAAP
jgi:hypothetical protein